MTDDQITSHSRIDGAPTRWGSGWYSGVAGIFLGAVGLGAVLCFRFPDLLTMPELRQYYPVPLIRAVLHVVLVTAFLCGVISIVLRRRLPLGSVSIGLVLLAALLGGSQAEWQGDVTNSGPFLGLDWFLLNLMFWSAIFVPLERLYPHDAQQPVFREGWRTDLAYFFVSALALQMMTLMTLKPATLLFAWTTSLSLRTAVAAQPYWLQFIEILLITDLVQYWVHRLFHQVPFLWRFHEIHHSATAMDWLAGSRLHIVDAVCTRAMTYVPLFALGFSDPALAVYVAFVTVQATFIHANVRFRFGRLAYLIATPQFHHWHHSTEDVAVNKNFAVHLAIWDLLFGTFYLPKNVWPKTYGVGDTLPPEGYLRQLVFPFQNRQTEPAFPKRARDTPKV